MQHRNRRNRVRGALAAAAVAVAVLIPAGTAFADELYPGPSVSPTTVTRDPGSPTEVKTAQATKTASGSLAFTGGDIVGLAAIGAGTAVVGTVLVRRSRARRVA